MRAPGERPGRAWARLVGTALCLALPALIAAPATADDGSRLEGARADLAETGVHLEPAQADGDTALWRERLESALADADLGVPIHVALWAEVPGTLPSLYDGDIAADLFAMLDIEDGILVHDQMGAPTATIADGLDGVEVRAEVRAVAEATDALADELVAASGDPDRYEGFSTVAWVWTFLRLAAPDPPLAGDLVAELAGDTSLLVDLARAPEGEFVSKNTDLSPQTLVVVGVMALVTAGALAWRRRSLLANREPDVQPEPDPMLADLTDLALEQQVTSLAEAIAASDRAPGDRHYDRAQACADAAAAYVDSTRDRDRVGVHQLVADGLRSLSGTAPTKRCFFHPAHRATTSLKRKGAKVPCCAACADAVLGGTRPASLLVADGEGRVAAYYETDDVWTRTGYGATDRRWARRALLANLVAR